MILIHNKKMLH